MAACGYYDDEKKTSDEKPKVDVIFCGNPGVGKSTLLSCISGVRFESGVSFITGKTQELRFQSSGKMPGFRFADTPGLTDVMTCKKAGKQITKAFENARDCGRYVMIVFVLIANGGRIRPEDLWTISTVMDAVIIDGRQDETDNLYSIIINNCGFMRYEKLAQEGMNQFKAYFCKESVSVPYTTSLLYFIPVIEKLVGKENATVEMPDLTKFLLGCSYGIIKKVGTINVDNLREQIDNMKDSQKETEKQVEALLAHKEELEKRVADLDAAHEERINKNPLEIIMGAIFDILDEKLGRNLEKYVAEPVEEHVLKHVDEDVIKPVDKHVVRPVIKFLENLF